ncbi:MAG: Holliday junction resolvase RuvX [Candidatus Omnitrophota bacterium]|nr:Holliday junction resolvase RuvX [Candidatus Omnitrophota bacterium]
MRIMGLDIGTKNIGVAVSDETGTIAQGREVVRRTSEDSAITRIERIVEEYGVAEIVLGLPINMNGTVGERAEDSMKFAKKLEKRTGLPVKLWDERLSTREMENIMIKASVRRSRRKEVVDKLAAQIILQSYLESRKSEE